MDNFVDDVPIPQIGTDLFGGYEDDEEPLDSGPALISETFEAEVEAEVEAEADTPESVASLNNDSDDENQNGTADDLDDFTEMVDNAPIPASAKKRGRPSLSASRTSTPAKTPKSAKGGPTSAASTGRKRKTVDSTAEPPAKRPGRATAMAAQDAIKEVSKKRHRAPNGSAKPKSAKTPGRKPGRKPKAKVEAQDEDEDEDEGDKPDVEYEVEKIVDDGVEDKTKKAIFLVKWKGYSQKDNTWEPIENLANASVLLKEYEASQKDKKAAPKKAALIKASAAKKTAAPVKKAAASAKKASPVKAAGRASRRGPGRPKRH